MPPQHYRREGRRYDKKGSQRGLEPKWLRVNMDTETCDDVDIDG